MWATHLGIYENEFYCCRLHLILIFHQHKFQFLPRDARSAKRGIAIVNRPSVRP